VLAEFLTKQFAKRGSEIAARRASLHPPLEGEGRRVAAGWGDGLSTRNSAS
jgi:hypothetical protein